MARAREQYRLAEALRAEERAAPSPHEPPPPLLPDLAQVMGEAGFKAPAAGGGRNAGGGGNEPTTPPHDETRALFGGWRIGDWKKREG